MSPLYALLFLQAASPYDGLADLIPDAQWVPLQRYIEGKGEAPEFLPPDATPLVAQQKGFERWGGLFARLRLVSDAPYEGGKVDVAKALKLERYVVYSAHALFSQGERKSAVTILLDGMTMARRMKGQISEDCQMLVFKSFDQHLRHIPLADCDRVRAATDGWLNAEADQAAMDGRMRILRLKMRVEAYRWQNLKLPGTLGEAAPKAETLDVSGGRPYRYETFGATYRISPDGEGA